MMDKNERNVLRNYLVSFESRKKGHKPQSLVLLDLLEKYPDDDGLMKQLKKKVSTEDARRMVMTRLREKMLSCLILDVNLNRKDAYDEQARALATVIQGKLQGRLLIARGQRDIGFRVLEHSIRLAKQFELYDDLVDMLAVERQFIKTWKGTDASYYKVDAEIQNYAKSRDAVMLARKYYEEIIMKYGFKGLNRASPDQEQLTFLKTRMDELNGLFDETSSATVGYYYYYLQIEYCQIQNDLKSASTHLNNLAQMVENNPSISRKVRLATVYGNLGANELWRHEFVEAEQFFVRSLEYLRENSRNHALITEYLFYARFYSGRLDEARKTLDSLVENEHIDQSDFRKAVRNYLLACVAFAQGDHKKVSRYLMDSQAIGKDKEGWNIGSRVLSILQAIESDNFDFADSLIVNLRQFINEGLKGIAIRQRDRIILEILLELRKRSYDLAAVKKSKGDLLDSLAENHPETGWTLQTPEMICFHAWFHDRLNGQPYSPDYSEQHIYGAENRS